MERLRRADVVAAGAFNGDEIVDIEEENDDFFYDSKTRVLTVTTTYDLRIEFSVERMERLRRADVVAAGAFNGDEIVDIEEENDDFFYDSKSDQLHFGFLIHLHDSLSTVNVPLSLLISPSPYFRSASHVMSNLEVEAVDFEPEEDDFMDEDVGAADYLLSSSVDESVRLWRVYYDECLATFSHNNFVTCVAFNPVDDNYFISGSFDGKVRIWDVSHCRVVDYTDVRDIVTAVCYRPDAKAAVIGSITGNCRFTTYLAHNQLQMDREINLSHGKKKVPSKRITGLEYFPSDWDKTVSVLRNEVGFEGSDSGEETVVKRVTEEKWVNSGLGFRVLWRICFSVALDILKSVLF
ncbi:hypothetical protein F2Q70_00045052 [Brassica cretica]|uniref:Anaphase-promoting complex subunit 4 WD40 domain-containing protein n=1 Tax=Brassica cretica TaxID=69181 RepID=A0A8S9KJB4_BRACR|nr:hypothetical protein F2Q70_00045052 [Brassica cretica]